jgi:hypothetical protein
MLTLRDPRGALLVLLSRSLLRDPSAWRCFSQSPFDFLHVRELKTTNFVYRDYGFCLSSWICLYFVGQFTIVCEGKYIVELFTLLFSCIELIELCIDSLHLLQYDLVHLFLSLHEFGNG